jgi:hypothetical protein
LACWNKTITLINAYACVSLISSLHDAFEKLQFFGSDSTDRLYAFEKLQLFGSNGTDGSTESELKVASFLGTR